MTQVDSPVSSPYSGRPDWEIYLERATSPDSPPEDRLLASLQLMGPTQRSKLAADLTPRFPPGKRYVPHVPHPPQQAFLLLGTVAEGLYGGAAGGGKSDAGLMGSLQYVDVPGYSALVIRRTFQDLALPGAIMHRAGEWLQDTGARKKDGGKLWEFPTSDPSRPATLQFGYAQTHADVYRYQGAEFQSIFVDELTHFEERTYRYLFSRLRGPAAPCEVCGHPTSQPAGEPRQHDEDHDHCACGHEHTPWAECEGPAEQGGFCGCTDYRPVRCECVQPVADRAALDPLGRPLFMPAPDGMTLADVPLRMRAGSNPGGVGHEWVRARFIAPDTRDDSAVFVPAKISDNPSLDRKAYRASLGQLSEVEQKRLEDGDWDVADEGTVFKRGNFPIVDQAPAECRRLRYWDMAATVPKKLPGNKGTKDPDWTVGTLMGEFEGIWYVIDVIRFRGSPLDVENRIKQTAALDGRRVPVRMEQEPGSSGVAVIDHYRRTVLVGFDFDGNRPELSKEERAAPLARASEAGNVRLISAPWNREWLDEVAGFPMLPHDDQVDSASGAQECLIGRRRARIIA
jgi:predicted phage terminase large subunit-like protein